MASGSPLKSLYINLIEDGYEVGTEKEFLEKLNDPEKCETLKSFLINDYGLSSEELDNIIETQKILDEEEGKEFPSIIKMGRNLATEMWNTLKAKSKGQNVLVSAEIAEERMQICLGCPYLKYDEEHPRMGRSGRCTECGCFMEYKTHFASAECPKEKWKN
tara:strand:- start:624 stop:1106 length:483 start_codon:yes stop_codon:yes gene_type:complete